MNSMAREEERQSLLQTVLLGSILLHKIAKGLSYELRKGGKTDLLALANRKRVS